MDTSIRDRLAKAIFETVEAPILLLDPAGTILEFNRACESLTEYTAEEVIGRKVWDVFILEEELGSVERIFARSLDKTTSFTNYWRTKSGAQRLIEWSNCPLFEESGTVGAILATGIDITESALKDEALTENKAFLESIINVSPEAVITISEQGKILSFSKQAQETFGYDASEVTGKSVNILMPEPDRSNHDIYIGNYLKSGNAKIIGRARQVTALRKNGEQFPALLHVGEFIDGEHIFVGFVEDITEKAHLETQLTESQFQLQHAGRLAAMGEVTAAISHELNQPLTAAASLAGAAALTIRNARSNAADGALELIDDAVNEIRRASEMIRKMRDFVRRGKITKSPYNINELVSEAMTIGMMGIGQDTIEVRTDLSDEVGSASVDRIQIQQVVSNLVRNAAEALNGCPKGTISLKTTRENGWVIIRVCDDGPGLRDDIKQHLFEPFVTSKDEGMGIGLSISKAIVDSHQGIISVEDNHPKGTIFELRLPGE